MVDKPPTAGRRGLLPWAPTASDPPGEGSPGPRETRSDRPLPRSSAPWSRGEEGTVSYGFQQVRSGAEPIVGRDRLRPLLLPAPAGRLAGAVRRDVRRRRSRTLSRLAVRRARGARDRVQPPPDARAGQDRRPGRDGGGGPSWSAVARSAVRSRQASAEPVAIPIVTEPPEEPVIDVPILVAASGPSDPVDAAVAGVRRRAGPRTGRSSVLDPGPSGPEPVHDQERRRRRLIPIRRPAASPDSSQDPRPARSGVLHRSVVRSAAVRCGRASARRQARMRRRAISPSIWRSAST